MKQLPYHPYRWGLGLLIPGFLLGCSDEVQIFRPADSNEGLRLELQASIDQVNETRADENGFADSDRFGVFVVNYSDNQPGTLTLSDNQANNIAFSFNADANKWQAASDIYWRDAETPADIYGYYPFHNGLGDVDAYRFEVQPDQSISGSDGDMGNYEASDFLWAKKGAAKPGQKVELTFSHIMAGVKVTLQKGSGFEGDSWEKLPKLVTVDNTLRTANINLSTGVATPSGNFDRNIVMNPESDAYRAVVVPQSVAAGKSVVGITIDGVSYSFTRDGKGMDYASGKLHTFTIKIDRKSDEGNYALTLVNEDITPWEADQSSHDFEANSYLVVHVAEPGTLKASLEALQCDLSTLKNLKVTGNITNEDFQFMHDGMPELTMLNLKESICVDISWNRIEEVSTNYWDNVTYNVGNAIPMDAFYGKSNLRRIVLPEKVERIGPNAFSELRLTSTLIIPESVRHIDDGAFASIGDEATLIMPSSLEYIGHGAFYGLSANMELKLSNTIKYIGGYAFFDAHGVTGTFNVPNKLEYIGDNAFANCGHDLVGDIVIPVSIQEIPNGAFSEMNFKNGTNLSLPEGLKKIGGHAFGAIFSGIKFLSPVIIPESVEYIAGGAFHLCSFAGGVVKFSDKIKYIGRHAFAGTNINGTLTFPSSLDIILGGEGDNGGAFDGTKFEKIIISDNVIQIEENAFGNSDELQYLEIGKNVEYIGAGAFSGTKRLQTVVCLSTTPPTAFSNTFSDIYFDKCILEVPEAAIEAYRHAKGWNLFQNITPHRELSFNIPDIACLDKGITREGILRSEGKWSVEYPSWVHVTPDHGDYKDQITVTVDPLPIGADSREGEIIFKLNDKDYSTYTTVRQLSYDHTEDTEILLQEATAGASEIPIFIVGEGFSADDIANGEYMRRMKETMEQLFSVEPYKSYRNYFTVTTSIACSPDNGTGDIYTSRHNCFESDGVQPDRYKLQQYVEKVSHHAGNNMADALIIMVSNYKSFSGWSEIDWNGCSYAGIGLTDDIYPYDQRGLVQHYAGGEAFAGLGNEMVSHFEHIKGCTCPCCNALDKYNDMKSRGYYANLTMSSKMSDAPWKDFIFNPKYSSMVDMWEGGYNHLRGVWRSEANSVMNTYIAYFNTISRYTIYKEIMRRAGKDATLDDFIANDKIELP